MILTNYHMHTKFCDGESNAEEYVLKAIEKRMKSIGIVAHSPVSFESPYNMKKNRITEYFDELDALKKKYDSKIQIYVGLEIDYVNLTDINDLKSFENRLDYKIGSLHYIWDENTKEYYGTDGSFDEVKKTFEVLGKGDNKKCVALYYKELINMIKTHKFEILGHLDIIKKRNNNNVFFDENEQWYKELVCELLDVIVESGVLVEINTGGMIRGAIKETYPSEWIIKECYNRGIEIVLNSDAHNAGHIDMYLQETANALKNIGFKFQTVLMDKGWTQLEL